MGRICYVPKTFSTDHAAIIDAANQICERYALAGLNLTLRQLYYQFIARDLFPESRGWIRVDNRWVRTPGGTRNADPNYKWLGEIVNDARMAGEIDWDYLADRTRNLVGHTHWDSPDRMIRAAADQYWTDLWASQRLRVEVWIEKDAAIGVIEAVCHRNDVAYFSCRGYTSVSEVWAASQRIGGYLRNGERVIILHLGDHDPSGLDMTRDVDARLRMFVTRDWLSDHHVRGTAPRGGRTVGDIRQSMRDHMGLADGVQPWTVHRIALTYAQIEEQQPPPNPAKTTDSRFAAYQEATGLDESWELDALDPLYLEGLIQGQIDAVRDPAAWADAQRKLAVDRELLSRVSGDWPEIRSRYDSDALLTDTDTDTDTESGDDHE